MALGDAYATAEELEAEFRIDDAVDSAHTDLAVRAASSWVTAYCARDFNKTTAATARTFSYGGGESVWVDDFHTVTGLLVATDDAADGSFATAWTTDDYELAPLNGIVAGQSGWPYTRLRSVGSRIFPAYRDRALVRVTAQWGWPEVPPAVKKATLIQAARLYKRRDSADGVLGGSDFGPVRVGTRIDPDVEALLAPFRKYLPAVA